MSQSELPIDVFDRLLHELHDRKLNLPAGSYTTLLLKGGVPKIASKIREEAEELIQAADTGTDDQVIHETCDLIYHTFVMLAHRGLSLHHIRTELTRREGTSGLDEKASRRPT